MFIQSKPIWLKMPEEIEAFPVRCMNNNVLHCRLSLPKHWDVMPEMTETPLEIEHIFRGSNMSECLTINFMNNVDLQADIRDWLDSILALTGFPILGIKTVYQEADLITWIYQKDLSLAKEFDVDEFHAYQGLAQLSDNLNLNFLYVLLARRGKKAWKICLSLDSTYTSQTVDSANLNPDYEKAGSIFGNLFFLPDK